MDSKFIQLGIKTDIIHHTMEVIIDINTHVKIKFPNILHHLSFVINIAESKFFFVKSFDSIAEYIGKLALIHL
ncbi:hypothetical protein HOG21_07590 [bacterium]|jgi:hypothetical protein|nr:hypothetical protein [bacterium]